MKENPGLVEPGRGENQKIKADSPSTALDHQHQEVFCVDPRAAILLRAACRYDLLRAGVLSLDEAFDLEFVCAFLTAADCCSCWRAGCSCPRARPTQPREATQ